MNRIVSFSLLFAMPLVGCGHEPPAKSTEKEPVQMNQANVVKTIAVRGFDPDGEPEIREMSDGTIVLIFNFMPPSYAEDEEVEYADFDEQLERAIGVPVRRDDRELFVIPKPRKDTVEKLKSFLETYRANQAE